MVDAEDEEGCICYCVFLFLCLLHVWGCIKSTLLSIFEKFYQKNPMTQCMKLILFCVYGSF